MSESKIQLCLQNAVIDFLEIQEIIFDNETFPDLVTIDRENLSFENEVFEPEGKDFWCSYYFLPNNPEWRTLGKKGFCLVNT